MVTVNGCGLKTTIMAVNNKIVTWLFGLKVFVYALVYMILIEFPVVVKHRAIKTISYHGVNAIIFFQLLGCIPSQNQHEPYLAKMVPTAIFWCLAHGLQSLPLFSIVLHSFLRYCAGDDLQYIHYGVSESAVLAEALLMLFFVWMLPSIWSSWKWRIAIHRDWVIHPSFWGMHLINQTFHIFVIAVLIIEILLMLFSAYNAL